MLDLKGEVLNKQKELGDKVDIYNQVINENLDSVNDIFKDSKYKVDVIEEKDGSKTLELRLVSDRGYSQFRYRDIIHKGFRFHRGLVEAELKSFIVDIAIETGVDIKEGIGDYKIGTKVELIKDLTPEGSKEIIKKGLKGEVTNINYKTQEIRVDLEDAVVSTNDEKSMKDKFKII